MRITAKDWKRFKELSWRGDNATFQEILDYIELLEKYNINPNMSQKEIEEKFRTDREEEQKEEKEKVDNAQVEQVTCMDLPLDWNNLFDSDDRTKDVHVDSIADGLIKSLTTLGTVDIEFISSITGVFL